MVKAWHIVASKMRMKFTIKDMRSSFNQIVYIWPNDRICNYNASILVSFQISPCAS